MGRTVSLIGAALLTLAACGGDDGDGGEAAPDTAADSLLVTGTEAAAGSDRSEDDDRCSLLTAEEVEAVIGPHDGGLGGLEGGNAIYGASACVWTSTNRQESEDLPLGYAYDAVEVAVLEGQMYDFALANNEVEGDPVAGLVDGAVFDSTAGELWFECGTERLCFVGINTTDSDGRQQAALELGRLVLERA
jgi:hypothetical protein